MCESTESLFSSFCTCSVEYKGHLKKKRNIPDIQHELNIAKSILQQTSSMTGDNVYEHLCEIIRRILDENPPNLIDYFEEYSRNIREKKYLIQNDFLHEAFEDTPNYKQARAIINKFKPLEYEGIIFMPEEITTKARLYRPIKVNENVIKMQFIWSLCGLGLHSNETFLLSCAMEKLQQHPVIKNARFWGKIFGLHNNYYIAEATLHPNEIQKRLTMMKTEIKDRMEPITNDNDLVIHLRNLIEIENLKLEKDFNNLSELKEFQDFIADYKEPPIPVAKIVSSFDIPPEPPGVGLNRYTYFVVNELTDDWIELPSVTPKQISESYFIIKYLKGDLEADIVSYPYFHGKEKHYLRALIARITSSTYVAPNGLYKILKDSKRSASDDEEEETEDDESEENEYGAKNEDSNYYASEHELILNSKYKPISINDQQDIRTWVHIRPLISKQCRATYFDEKKAQKLLDSVNRNSKSMQNRNDEYESETENDDQEGNDDESDSETQESATTIKSDHKSIRIPMILDNCGDDKTAESIPPWTSRLSHTFNKTNIVVIMNSNLWPGSYSFAYENISDNLYIGWGNKYLTRNFSPPHLPQIQNEYPVEESITEIVDPTPSEENEWRLSKPSKPIENLNESDENAEEKEGEEYEGDNYDDDDDDESYTGTNEI